MADIILIQPNVGNWDKVRSHPAIPLALLSASRLLAKDFNIVLIDQRTEKDWKARLIDELRQRPLCVGITSITGKQIFYALEAAKAVRLNSDIPIIWGGIHATLLPDSTLESEFVDILVNGEGEITFYEIVRALASGSPLEGIEGAWFKKQGSFIKNRAREFCSLDELPPLPYHLVEMDKYLPKFKGRRTLYMESSRGCPNQCTFCYNQVYSGRKWRAISAARVIEEIKEAAAKYGIKSFYLVDDNFFVDLPRFRKIAEGLIHSGLDIIWEAQGITIQSALKMNEDDLDMLEKSGCKKLHFGIETGSEKIMKLIKKNIKISEILEINRKFKKVNIVLQYNFMAGFPDEEHADIRKTVDLIWELTRENKKAIISPICPYTPYPGTEIFQKALKQGFIKKNRLEDWDDTNYGNSLWESRDKSSFLNALFFTSMFLDLHRLKDMLDNPLYKTLIYFYRPIARFRVRKLFFKFMPEYALSSIIINE